MTFFQENSLRIFLFSIISFYSLFFISDIRADKNQNNQAAEQSGDYPPYEPKDGDQEKRLEYTCFFEVQMKDWDKSGKDIKKLDSDNHDSLHPAILTEACDNEIFGKPKENFERDFEFTAETKKRWLECKDNLKEGIKKDIKNVHASSFAYFKKIVRECKKSMYAKPKDEKQRKEKREASKYCFMPLKAYKSLKPNASNKLFNYHNLHKISYKAVSARHKDLKHENSDPTTGKTRCKCHPPEEVDHVARKSVLENSKKEKFKYICLITPTPINTPDIFKTPLPSATPTPEIKYTPFASPTPTLVPTKDGDGKPTVPPMETPPYA